MEEDLAAAQAVVGACVEEGGGEAAERRLKAFVRRGGDGAAQAACSALFNALGSGSSQARCRAFALADALFTRSAAFRAAWCAGLDITMRYAVGTDPEAPLPPPAEAAAELREAALQALQRWAERFGAAHPRLLVAARAMAERDARRVAPVSEEEARRRNTDALAESRLSQADVDGALTAAEAAAEHAERCLEAGLTDGCRDARHAVASVHLPALTRLVNLAGRVAGGPGSSPSGTLLQRLVSMRERLLGLERRLSAVVGPASPPAASRQLQRRPAVRPPPVRPPVATVPAQGSAAAAKRKGAASVRAKLVKRLRAR